MLFATYPSLVNTVLSHFQAHSSFRISVIYTPLSKF